VATIPFYPFRIEEAQSRLPRTSNSTNLHIVFVSREEPQTTALLFGGLNLSAAVEKVRILVHEMGKLGVLKEGELVRVELVTQLGHSKKARRLPLFRLSPSPENLIAARVALHKSVG